MAEELRIMENKSREDTNLSPVSKIEIYSFFDPFSKDCFKLSAILSKLRIEYNKYIKVTRNSIDYEITRQSSW